jgi:hypothetical protein
MELYEKYIIELINFQNAFTSFKTAFNFTFKNLDRIGGDLIKMIRFKNLNNELN